MESKLPRASNPESQARELYPEADVGVSSTQSSSNSNSSSIFECCRRKCFAVMKQRSIESPCVMFSARRERGRVRSPRPDKVSLAFAMALALVSCNNDKIEVYRIPKETLNVAMERGSLVPPAPNHSAKWVKPDGWTEQPLSEMRVGSFKVEGPDSASADISVVAFPGDAGGLASNINRWRGQLELPPLEEQQLLQMTQKIEVQGAPVCLVDLQTAENSAKPSRILGAVLERPDRTWFVKMTGSPALLEKQRQFFFDFVKSFRFDVPDESGEPASSPKQKSTNDE